MSTPTTLAVRAAQIPDELKRCEQWVVWRHEQRDQRWTKPPRDPATGKLASVSESLSWATFAAALTASTRYDGVGLVLTPDDPYVAIDLDDCVDGGAVESWAQAIVDRFKSYTEVSPSGSGLRLIVRGVLPLGRNRTGAIECYDAGRFVTLTGHTIDGFTTIRNTQRELIAWHRETFGPELIAEPKQATCRHTEMTQDDAAILERARHAQGFDALYSGDLSAYSNDHSAADLAFCNVLVNVGASAEQIDSLMRSSGLFREKWNRLDYAERTISKAFDRAPHLSTNDPQGMRVEPCATQLAALSAQVAQLTRERDELKRALTSAQTRIKTQDAELKQLRALQSDTIRMLSNKELGQARVTGLVLSYEFAHRESAGDSGDDGLHKIPLARIAERAGISTQAASAHVKKLEQFGVLYKRVETVPETLDATTGELVPLHRELRLAPVDDAIGFARALATFKPDSTSNWGGARTKCPRCGSEQRVTSCASCGLVLAASSNTQDDSLSVAAPPNSQDDRSIDGNPQRERGITPNNHLDRLRQSLVSRADQRPPELSRPPLSVGLVGSPGNDRWTH